MLADNSHFNADGAGNNDHQYGLLRAMAMRALGLLPGQAAVHQYGGGTPVIAGSAVVANAVATATLAAPGAGRTNYLSGFEVTGAGATASAAVTVTVTGLLGGTRSYVYVAEAGVAVGNKPLIVQFVPPLPASAANTAIAVSCPALGAGNTANVVVAHGFHAA